MFISAGSAVAQTCVNGRKFAIASCCFGLPCRPPNTLHVMSLISPVRCLRVDGPDPGGMTCRTVESVLVISASSDRVSGTLVPRAQNWRSANLRLICVLRLLVLSGSHVLIMNCSWPSELRGNTPRMSMLTLSPRISVAMMLRSPSV